jgi:hypothetical protein
VLLLTIKVPYSNLHIFVPQRVYYRIQSRYENRVENRCQATMGWGVLRGRPKVHEDSCSIKQNDYGQMREEGKKGFPPTTTERI